MDKAISLLCLKAMYEGGLEDRLPGRFDLSRTTGATAFQVAHALRRLELNGLADGSRVRLTLKGLALAASLFQRRGGSAMTSVGHTWSPAALAS